MNDGTLEPVTDRRPRRCRGERGTAVVTALVLLFSFTAGAVIWLSRDVNRRVSNRSAAQSIAFQAARAGAQQVEVGGLRDDASTVVIIEPAAKLQANQVAHRLFDEFEVDGNVESVIVSPTGDEVRVVVVITDPAGSVSGYGSARAVSG